MRTIETRRYEDATGKPIKVAIVRGAMRYFLKVDGRHVGLGMPNMVSVEAAISNHLGANQ